MKKVEHPAKTEYLSELIIFVIDLIDKKSFSQKRILQAELIFEELFTNIITHAYPNSSGKISIECIKCNEDQVVFEIQDQGIPFNILTTKESDTKSDLDHRQEGGLGVHFVKQYTDHIDYQRKNNTNILTITIKNR